MVLSGLHKFLVTCSIGMMLSSFSAIAPSEEIDIDAVLLEIETATKRKTPNFFFSCVKNIENKTNEDVKKWASKVEFTGNEYGYFKKVEEDTHLPGGGNSDVLVGERMFYSTPDFYLEFKKDADQVQLFKHTNPVQTSPYWENIYRNIGLSYHLLNDDNVEIQSCKKVSIQNEKVIRIEYTRNTIGRRTEFTILTVLPEQGYRIKSEYVFIGGILRRVLRFEGYEEKAPGDWVPLKMSRISYPARYNNEHLEEIFSSKNWGQLDNVDLGTINTTSSYSTVHSEIQFNFLDTLDINELDFVIEKGITVYKEDVGQFILSRYFELPRDVKASQVLKEVHPFSFRRIGFLLSQMKVLLILVTALYIGMIILSRFVHTPKTSPEIVLHEESNSS